MSVETPNPREFEERMNAQKKVASEMLGFDVDKKEEMTPEEIAKFIKWINENGMYFKNILEKNTDIWERVQAGAIQYSDIGWIVDQLRDDYDLGAEDHENDRGLDD